MKKAVYLCRPIVTLCPYKRTFVNTTDGAAHKLLRLCVFSLPNTHHTVTFVLILCKTGSTFVHFLCKINLKVVYMKK